MARRSNSQYAMLISMVIIAMAMAMGSAMGAQQLHAGVTLNIRGKVDLSIAGASTNSDRHQEFETTSSEAHGLESGPAFHTSAVRRRLQQGGPVATGSFTSITIPLRVCGNAPTVSNSQLRDQVMGSGRSLKSFIDQCSFGALDFDTSSDKNMIVTTPVPINGVCSGNNVNCNNIDEIGQEAENWLSKNGYDMDKYSVRILIFPADMPGCGRISVGRWGCFTNNPGPATPSLMCRTWLTNGDVLGLIHEVGHNLGLSHANLGSQDAGDMTSPMGYTGDFRCHNAYHASLLNWVKPVQTVNIGDLNGGQWKNVPLPSRVNTATNYLKLTGSGKDLFVSYTSPVGWESNVADSDSYQLMVHSEYSDSDWSRSNLLARLNNNQRADIGKWVIRVTGTSNNGATAQICRQESNSQCQAGSEPAASASIKSTASGRKRELSAEAASESEEKSPRRKATQRRSPPPKKKTTHRKPPPPKKSVKKPRTARLPRPPPRRVHRG